MIQGVGFLDSGIRFVSCALVEHSAGEVEGCHRILQWMLDELLYLAS
jgi:hypothetical protein